MTVLLDAATLRDRRQALAGSLGSLARSLAADLGPVLAHDVRLPDEKARLSRRGGRCETDGTLLDFDPFTPRRHRCGQCGAVYEDESHYRWWIMGYHLWLAERSVHAAALHALTGDARIGAFARRVLDAYADRYLTYPNADNVLGPTRPFFSTYLESIWLLQLCVALDLLEESAPSRDALGARVRERVIEPSARLIAGYDEGMSNRQVWNNAALLTAARMLGGAIDERALFGRSGLVAHLSSALLADGTWYEGENYHLFAHRGLWYGVMAAEHAGLALESALIARFDEAFATPFLTALPDYTFPSRRDSQYRVSLRQWRFAELAELGLVRRPGDERLRSALATLYADGAPRVDTGRATSTAEAERNSPATALDRSDLGWRSLLFALPTLPSLEPRSPRSVLMPGQGLAILRRERGALYAALDYGHSGAGHGHPDRLNVLLAYGRNRWLDDVGTGSYVDPSLHWYRSTLAHNAPLVNGQSQRRVHGTLVAYEDRAGAGWVRAAVEGIAPGVRVERTLVALPDYLVDELTWSSDREIELDLPFHVDGDLVGARRWTPAPLTGGADAEDGFGYLSDVEVAETAGDDVRLDAGAVAHVSVDGQHRWWRATSLGPPGVGTSARFHLVRTSGRRGAVRTVWDWRGVVAGVACADGVVTVALRDGGVHEHRGDVDGWHIALRAGAATSSIDLGGLVPLLPAAPPVERAPIRPIRMPRVDAMACLEHDGDTLRFALGEAQYHRSEPTWAEAGRPSATVSVGVVDDLLAVLTDVVKPAPHFRAGGEENLLDNELADINSDGVQVHLRVGDPRDRDETREYRWLLVPEPGSDRVRVSPGPGSPTVNVSWRRTAHGFAVRWTVALAAIGVTRGREFGLGVVVNDMAAHRERRRGQLVLGATAGEFVYLRGDRLPAERLLPFVIADG